jgi:hypothetical protein
MARAGEENTRLPAAHANGRGPTKFARLLAFHHLAGVVIVVWGIVHGK